MAEAIVGDLTPYCGVSKAEKMQRELAAMGEITKPMGAAGDRLMTLFLVRMLPADVDVGIESMSIEMSNGWEVCWLWLMEF